ncbi:MAG TPA: ABC transporter substrate-binding protein [Thermoanaerobaculia bacterium]|jgi:polar amino acid transport system substrate-binding protein|nr:ABC transporter substrate-binding protein [Thermoanaerobaculia bacterium]
MRLAASAALCLLLTHAAAAGDLAEVKGRGKLIMLTYPVQGTHFISVNLDVMREQGLKLVELRKPEQFQGIDVELMSGFARSLGVALEIHAVTGGYGALIPALLAREGDLVASEFTITPGRRAKADFSRPYVSNWVAVVVRRASSLGAAADLGGKKGAVLAGSSHIEFLHAAAPSAAILPTGFDLESLDAVESGKVDFALMDTGAAPGEQVDAIHPGLEVAFRLCEIGDGVAVRQGSDLLPALDAYLAGVRKSGELQRILMRNGFKAQATGPSGN